MGAGSVAAAGGGAGVSPTTTPSSVKKRSATSATVSASAAQKAGVTVRDGLSGNRRNSRICPARSTS